VSSRISVVVPVLNEAPTLHAFLVDLCQCVGDCEIILADGGSDDGSVEIAREVGAVVVPSQRGRAAQMNAGARAATGEVLWFVHADSRVPPNAANAIAAALHDRQVIGGSFRLRIDLPGALFRLRDRIANVLVYFGGAALGDRGFFCRREVFEQIGGFPALEFFEDAEFHHALKRRGRVVQLREAIITSGRQYQRYGRVRTIVFYAVMMLLYSARFPIALLQRCVRAFYRRV
jgi:rSAM/selenodomain-associated transferase 2